MYIVQNKISTSIENHIVSIQTDGDMDLQQSIDLITNLVNHPDFRSNYGVLADFRRVGATPTIMDMRELGAHMRKNKDKIKGKLAIVIRPEKHPLTSARAMLVRAFGIRMEVFDEIEPAVTYLIER